MPYLFGLFLYLTDYDIVTSETNQVYAHSSIKQKTDLLYLILRELQNETFQKGYDR